MQSYRVTDRATGKKPALIFHSKLEMRENFPCKLYKINDLTYITAEEHEHDYVQLWYVSKGRFTHSIHEKTYHMVKGN